MAKKVSNSTTSSLFFATRVTGRTDKKSSSHSDHDVTFSKCYIPSYFGVRGRMTSSEVEMDWNTYMNKPMSPQHLIVAKLKMFCETKFDVVILGKNQVKNRTLGNRLFKCFLDPLGKEVVDYIEEMNENVQGEADYSPEIDSNEVKRRVREMLAVKEDKIRYSEISVLRVYGLALRFHIATNMDKNGQSANIARQQIEAMANYLNFKKKYKSGFGMNTFLMIVEYNTKTGLDKVNSCMIEVLVAVFTLEIFNSLILLVESDGEKQETDKLVKEVRCNVSQKACCKPGIVNVFPARSSLTKLDTAVKGQDLGGNVKETTVAAAMRLLNEVARQTYIDPNPFEPKGMDYHDAMIAIESVQMKYQLKERDWYNVINHVYTMIPN